MIEVKNGGFEYVMSKEDARDILNARNRSEKKIPNMKYLLMYLNDQRGLLYEVKKVTIR